MSYDRDDLGYDLGYDSETSRSPATSFSSKLGPEDFQVKYEMANVVKGKPKITPQQRAQAAEFLKWKAEKAEEKKAEKKKTEETPKAKPKDEVDLSGKPQPRNPSGAPLITGAEQKDLPPPPPPENAYKKFEASLDPNASRAAANVKKHFGNERDAAASLSLNPPPDNTQKPWKGNTQLYNRDLEKWNVDFKYAQSMPVDKFRSRMIDGNVREHYRYFLEKGYSIKAANDYMVEAGLVARDAKLPAEWPEKPEHILGNQQKVPEKFFGKDGKVVKYFHVPRHAEGLEPLRTQEDLQHLRENVPLGKTQQERDKVLTEQAARHKIINDYDPPWNPDDKKGVLRMMGLMDENGRPTAFSVSEAAADLFHPPLDGQGLIHTDANGAANFRGGRIRTPEYLGKEIRPDQPQEDFKPGIVPDDLTRATVFYAQEKYGKKPPGEAEKPQAATAEKPTAGPFAAREGKASGTKLAATASAARAAETKADEPKVKVPKGAKDEDATDFMRWYQEGLKNEKQMAAQAGTPIFTGKGQGPEAMPAYNLPGSKDYVAPRNAESAVELAEEQDRMKKLGVTEEDRKLYPQFHSKRSGEEIAAGAKGKPVEDLTDTEKAKEKAKVEKDVQAYKSALAEEGRRMRGEPWNLHPKEVEEYQKQNQGRSLSDLQGSFKVGEGTNVDEYKAEVRNTMRGQLIQDAADGLRKIDPNLSPENATINAELLYWENTPSGAMDENSPTDKMIEGREKVVDSIHKLSQGSPEEVKGKMAALTERAAISEYTELSKKIDEHSKGNPELAKFYGDKKTGEDSKKLFAKHHGVDLSNPHAIRNLRNGGNLQSQLAEFAQGPGKQGSPTRERIQMDVAGTKLGELRRPDPSLLPANKRGEAKYGLEEKEYFEDRNVKQVKEKEEREKATEIEREKRGEEREEKKEKRERQYRREDEAITNARTYAMEKLKQKWDKEREDRDFARQTVNTLLFQPLSQAFSGALNLSGQALASTTQSAERQRETADNGIWRMLSPGGAA